MERALTLEGILEHYKARAAREQGMGESVTRYFCPLRRCQGDKRPHFIVDKGKAIDQYGKPIDFTHHVNKSVVVRYHWRCEHSHTEGYGTMSLMAAILGFPSDLSRLSRDQWVKLITAARDVCGVPCTELEPNNRNGWLLEYAPTQQWSIRLADDFTPEAMRLLAVDGMEGIDTETIIDEMHQMFGLWQVEKYTTAGCYPSSDHTAAAFKSYERRAHALFPVFAFCYDCETGLPLTENPEKREEPWVARIVMPAFLRQPGEDFDWRADFWTAFGTDDARGTVQEFRRRFPIYGDVVAMECSRIAKPDELTPEAARSQMKVSDVEDDKSQTAMYASDIVSYYETGETLVTQKEQEVTTTNEKGKEKTEIKPVPMEPWEVKLNKCVLMKSPLDAVTAYLWLNYPRMRLPKGLHQNNYWHVAWLAHDSMQLNIFENNQLRRVANDTFELFGNERAEIALANTNALRYNYLRLCMLPTLMSEMKPVDSGLGIQHVPHTPIDFFRYYELTTDEQARNMLIVGREVGAKAVMLQRELVSSSAMRPFTQVPKKKKSPGEKSYTYDINMNSAWQMMSNKGYCRALLPNKKRDTIGQCYRIDGHFIYELNADSVMADMRKSLEDYAKDNAVDSEDAEMMLNAMLRCKDLQYSRNITRLPLIAMPEDDSYSSHLDYIFLHNGALQVTPESILFKKYADLDFLIYRSMVLPFDYVQPFVSKAPISCNMSEEFIVLQQQYELLRKDVNASTDQLFDLKRRLQDKSVVGRWDLRIVPTEAEIDDRIVVPKTILADTKHNEWLRWWPFLRLLRCMANEHFAEEEAGRFVESDYRELNARILNLCFTIGTSLLRDRSVQYMPFFLENTVDREGKAQGGSGKSVLVEHFFKFVRFVCNVNAKDLKETGDFARNFANFIAHHHSVVHFEDLPKMHIDPFFNYATGTFVSRSLFENPVEIGHKRSPVLVFTSNFMVQSTDESSLGRVQFGGVSHYFCREVAMMNKDGRRLDTIMPDIHINADQSDFGTVYDDDQRSQIIYTLAWCMQFAMRCRNMNIQIPVPGSDLLERLSRTEMGDSFYDWFTNFLQKPHIYNVPIAINEIFNSYRAYLDPSKARIEQVSRTRFYENMQKYCAKPAHGVLFMPIKPYLTTSEQNRSKKKSDDGTEKSYLRKYSSWLTRSFLDDQGRVHHARVLSKNAGASAATGGAVWFSQRGKEPKDADEFRQMVDAFLQAPDPEPILDADEQPITEAVYGQWTMLNTEEEAEIIRKAGGVRRPVAIPAATPATPITTPVTGSGVTGGEVAPGQDDLPF